VLGGERERIPVAARQEFRLAVAAPAGQGLVGGVDDGVDALADEVPAHALDAPPDGGVADVTPPASGSATRAGAARPTTSWGAVFGA
jgi:hypothetical protein